MNSKRDRKGYAPRSFFQETSTRRQEPSEMRSVIQRATRGRLWVKTSLSGFEHEL